MAQSHEKSHTYDVNLSGCYAGHALRRKAPATFYHLTDCDINRSLQTSQSTPCPCLYEETVCVLQDDRREYGPTDCHQIQASFASGVLTMHQAKHHHLHDVHGIQSPHGSTHQHHRSRLDARFGTPRASGDFPQPSWLSLRTDSEGGGTSLLRASLTRQSTEADDFMTSRQTLSYHSRSQVPEPSSFETLTTVEDLRSILPAEDVDELMHLQQLNRDTLSNLPLTEDAATSEVERLWQLYGLFVERQSLFYTRLPWFKLLATSDCPRLLRQAVAISTHVTAAQFMDERQYFWPRRNAPFVTAQSRVLLSASTIRQIVSHEHYVLLMTFYTHYAHLLADSNVALFTQVLSLFSETPGLSDPATVRLGREHYLGLVTRYLKAAYGWQRGSEMLQGLLASQIEAKRLSDIHQYVQLSPQVQKRNPRDVTHTFSANFQKTCFLARYAVTKVIERRQGSEVSNSGADLVPSSPPYSSTTTTEQLDHFTNLLTRLAECEDPDVLATARQLLPPDLRRRFLQLLQ